MKNNLRRESSRDGQMAISNFMSGQSVINVNDNYMVRPRKQDREAVALTHIRISLATKRLIDDLRLEHDFKTADDVLRFYLPPITTAAADESVRPKLKPRPRLFHSAREIYDLTHCQPVDEFIRGAASEIMKKTNSSKTTVNKKVQDKSKTNAGHIRTWQQQTRRKF